MHSSQDDAWRDIVARLAQERQKTDDPEWGLYACRSCSQLMLIIGSQRPAECSNCGRLGPELQTEAMVKINRRADAMAKAAEALATLRAGDVAAAIRGLEAAIAIDASYNEAHYNLGELYMQSGDIDKGIASSRKALQLNPSDAMAQLNIGAGLAMQGKSQEALVEFDKAVQLDPNNAMARFNRGLLLLKSSRIDEVRADWKKFLELEPQSERAPMVRDFFRKFGG